MRIPTLIAVVLVGVGLALPSSPSDVDRALPLPGVAPPITQTIPDSLVRPSEVPGAREAVVVAPSDPRLEDRLRIVHWPGDEARAAAVVETLERQPLLPGIPGRHPSTAVVFLAPDAERWEALTGGRAPHWGAGVAVPAASRIVLPVFRTPWDGFRSEGRTLRHEWAHLGLHDYLSGLRIPRWFDEGYAQWAAGGANFEQAWRLRLVLATGTAPPLDSLTLDWPRERFDAELAYLLSATAVDYLVRESGPRGMELFLSRWRETNDFEGAFRRTFGLTTGNFERLWIEHVKGRYGWLLMLSHSAVFWVVLGAGLLLLFRIRRRRDRERMAHLRATEPPDLPAYWEPPPHPPIGGFRDEGVRDPGDPGAPGGHASIDRTPPSG